MRPLSPHRRELICTPKAAMGECEQARRTDVPPSLEDGCALWQYFNLIDDDDGATKIPNKWYLILFLSVFSLFYTQTINQHTFEQSHIIQVKEKTLEINQTEAAAKEEEIESKKVLYIKKIYKKNRASKQRRKTFTHSSRPTTTKIEKINMMRREYLKLLNFGETSRIPALQPYIFSRRQPIKN